MTLSREELQDKLNELADYMGTENLIDEMARFLSTDDLQEMLTDIDNTHDLNVFGGDDDE